MVKEFLQRAFCSGWAVLFFIGVTYIARGIFYLPELVRDSDRIPLVEHYAPLWVWALLWVIAGVVLVILAWLHRHMPMLIGLAAGMSGGWAALYIGAWIAGASAAGYVTALSFVLIVVLIVAYFTLLYAVRGGEDRSTAEVSR